MNFQNYEIIKKTLSTSYENTKNINWSKIIKDIHENDHLYDDNINIYKNYNLDTNKLSYHEDRVKAYLRGEKVAPITIDMALTQKCGFACTYCYAGLQKNPASPANWDTYKNFLDDCISIGHKKGEGVKAISLVSDGESTMNPYYYDFIEYGKSLGMDMASGTNCHQLKKNKLKDLVKNLTYLRVNISAGEPKAFSEVMGVKEKVFYEVISNIKECIKIKEELNLPVTIGLQMVLLPEYLEQVIPLARLGRELNVDYTVIKHCSDDENGRLGVDYSWYKNDEVIETLKFAEGLSTENYSVQAKWTKLMTGSDRKYSKCFGPALMLQMSGTCLVAPCGSLFHTDYERFHIGNYNEQRFKDIWQSEKYWEVLGYIGSDKFDPRYRCATLCLQDKVNERLFDHIENNNYLSYSEQNNINHVNFI